MRLPVNPAVLRRHLADGITNLAVAVSAEAANRALHR
jgi:hypothetical protein